MRWDKRGKNGRFISERDYFDPRSTLPEEGKPVMVITAPNGQKVTLYTNGNVDDQCEAIHAFMEQQLCLL